MGVIKTSPNVEFDVIYADGTRRHVAEGVLFEVEKERIIFHNGTDRPEVILATAECAAEVVADCNFPVPTAAILACTIVEQLTGGRLDAEPSEG